MHGGVNFDPYRAQFHKLIPDLSMNYVETYNASEGFFGIQDQVEGGEMLLMLDYGIFFEFIPVEHYRGTKSEVICSIADVEPNVNYALVISTNGGLWRYIVGDTIRFTSIKPYRFKVTGRTKFFINTFGEELIVENAEMAIALACEKTHAQIRDFTACPVFMGVGEKGCHEWAIEFVKYPNEIERFIKILDEALREINSDYDAKRYQDMILGIPKINTLNTGVFDEWLRQRGKLGGQNKVPRLSNDRKIMEQILQLNEVFA